MGRGETKKAARNHPFAPDSPGDYHSQDLLTLTLIPRSNKHISVSFATYEFTIASRASQEGKRVVDVAIDLFMKKLRTGMHMYDIDTPIVLKDVSARLIQGETQDQLLDLDPDHDPDMHKTQVQELFCYDSWKNHPGDREHVNWIVEMKSNVKNYLYAIVCNFQNFKMV